MPRAGALACAVLIAASLAGCGEAEFSTDEWRAAHAADDYETIEDQARAAVESGVLVGRSREEVRSLLGRPDRIARKRRLWIWHVGFINDFIGPGDAGALFVHFEPGWTRVDRARVGLN